MKKRFLAALLCLVLIVGLLPATALAGEKFSTDNTTFTGGINNVTAPIKLEHLYKK